MCNREHHWAILNVISLSLVALSTTIGRLGVVFAVTAGWGEACAITEIIPISAASKFNVDYVMKRIKELLPDSPPYFGKDPKLQNADGFWHASLLDPASYPSPETSCTTFLLQ